MWDPGISADHLLPGSRITPDGRCPDPSALCPPRRKARDTAKRSRSRAQPGVRDVFLPRPPMAIPGSGLRKSVVSVYT